MNMRHLGKAALAFATCVLCILVGCSSTSGSASSSQSEQPRRVVIGTMSTEDMLPGWVAMDKGYFKDAGVDVSIESFDSAPALSAAIVAGQVDMALTDVMRAVKLCESGYPVVAEWVTLGRSADEGRFGVLAPKDAPYANLQELAVYVNEHPVAEGSGIGVAANTVPEYVLDMLFAQNNIDPTSIPTVEVASIPERYGLVAAGKLIGAALPNSMLTFGEASGMKVIADDTEGDALSFSLMIAGEQFAQNHAPEIEAIAQAWDRAVADINADPQSFISYLVQFANINETAVQTYIVSTYPRALEGEQIARPDAANVMAQITWMSNKGYGGTDIVYRGETGVFEHQ